MGPRIWQRTNQLLNHKMDDLKRILLASFLIGTQLVVRVPQIVTLQSEQQPFETQM